MTVLTNAPVLVGEWFYIRLQLKNKESVEVSNVTAEASLVEAHDPLISDTTKLTLDYR